MLASLLATGWKASFWECTYFFLAELSFLRSVMKQTMHDANTTVNMSKAATMNATKNPGLIVLFADDVLATKSEELGPSCVKALPTPGMPR